VVEQGQSGSCVEECAAEVSSIVVSAARGTFGAQRAVSDRQAGVAVEDGPAVAGGRAALAGGDGVVVIKGAVADCHVGAVIVGGPTEAEGATAGAMRDGGSGVAAEGAGRDRQRVTAIEDGAAIAGGIVGKDAVGGGAVVGKGAAGARERPP